ncbi:MAG: flagellar biosynthesis protein FlhB [Armatimonadetes bacterium]|nr:flagellar biosynthesis protein FlhB [Armatimonadota bacterium]
MADDSDKTEEPTEHKLQEARKKGQIFKSQDIISTLMLLATSCALLVFGKNIYRLLADFTYSLWRLIPDYKQEGRPLFADGLLLVVLLAKILLPILLVGFIMAFIANIAQIKFIFSTEPMNPKLSKINPIEGFKRIFSIKSLVELLKQLAKLSVVGWVAYKVVKSEINLFQYAVMWDINQTTHYLKGVIIKIIAYIAAAMAVIAIIDYIFQRHQYLKQMKMSIQELKDEYKDTEGNPQVKAKIRQLMRQGAMARMMEEVPDATAILTNPTHLAVALKYSQGATEAPIVVAKGERLVAVQIKVIAEDHDIPIVENVELAKALFKSCEIGQTIPVELYKAVAEVLAYLIKLKRKRNLRKRLPKAG